MAEKTASPSIKDGDSCLVIEGRHKGRRGMVEDYHLSPTGHATITVREASGERFKTLAKSVRQQ